MRRALCCDELEQLSSVLDANAALIPVRPAPAAATDQHRVTCLDGCVRPSNGRSPRPPDCRGASRDDCSPQDENPVVQSASRHSSDLWQRRSLAEGSLKRRNQRTRSFEIDTVHAPRAALIHRHNKFAGNRQLILLLFERSEAYRTTQFMREI